MRYAQALRFLAQRAEDGKEFIINGKCWKFSDGFLWSKWDFEPDEEYEKFWQLLPSEMNGKEMDDNIMIKFKMCQSEIDILKGRLAEGYNYIYRNRQGLSFAMSQERDDVRSTSLAYDKFLFLPEYEYLSLRELLGIKDEEEPKSE